LSIDFQTPILYIGVSLELFVYLLLVKVLQSSHLTMNEAGFPFRVNFVNLTPHMAPSPKISIAFSMSRRNAHFELLSVVIR
jgi:hypothetical protein